MSFKREMACFFVPGHGVLSITTNNTPGAVDFDFIGIWDKLKEIGEYPHVCMVHTHPDGALGMSETDKNMVYGWVQGLGKPVIYFIATASGYVAYHCWRDDNDINKVNRVVVETAIGDDVLDILVGMVALSERLGVKTEYSQAVEAFNNVIYKGLSVEIIEDEAEASV